MSLTTVRPTDLITKALRGKVKDRVSVEITMTLDVSTCQDVVGLVLYRNGNGLISVKRYELHRSDNTPEDLDIIWEKALVLLRMENALK